MLFTKTCLLKICPVHFGLNYFKYHEDAHRLLENPHEHTQKLQKTNHVPYIYWI